MMTQVIFKIDNRLKEQAIHKAQREGLSLTSILKLFLGAFVKGELNVGVVDTERFNERTRREIQEALVDVSEKKNLSPSFRSTKDAFRYLSR